MSSALQLGPGCWRYRSVSCLSSVTCRRCSPSRMVIMMVAVTWLMDKLTHSIMTRWLMTVRNLVGLYIAEAQTRLKTRRGLHVGWDVSRNRWPVLDHFYFRHAHFLCTTLPFFFLLLSLLAVVVICPHRCCILWFHSLSAHGRFLGEQGPRPPPSQRSGLPLAPQIKFLVSATRHMEGKISDRMLVC